MGNLFNDGTRQHIKIEESYVFFILKEKQKTALQKTKNVRQVSRVTKEARCDVTFLFSTIATFKVISSRVNEMELLGTMRPSLEGKCSHW